MITFIWTSYNTAKLAYHNPRPFWINPEINTHGNCDAGYGYPSGHSATAVGTSFALWLDFYASNPCKSAVKKILTLLLAIFVSASVMFSRVVLGMHSIDDVCMGALLGLWIAFTFEYCFKFYIKTEVKTVLGGISWE